MMMSKFAITVAAFAAATYALFSPTTAFAQGSGNQNVELEYGTNHTAYPLYIAKANPGECGPDTDDIVLVYNTPRSGRGNPDNIRLWTDNRTLRTVISAPQFWVRAFGRVTNIGGYGGYMTANGLRTPTTRMCVGSKGKLAGKGLVNDLMTTRLWYKN